MDNNVLNHLIEKINKSEKLKVEYGITGQEIKYDEDNDEYSIIYEGIKFSWEEKPDKDDLKEIKVLARNYHKNIDNMFDQINHNVRYLVLTYQIFYKL